MTGEFGMVSIRHFRIAAFSAMLFLLPSLAFAQSPWERAAGNLDAAQPALEFVRKTGLSDARLTTTSTASLVMR